MDRRWQTREALHDMTSKSGAGRLADDLRHELRVKEASRKSAALR